jgi:hypothetical protein
LSLDELVNKSVSSESSPEATSKKILRLSLGNARFNRIISRIIFCYEKAKHWQVLSPTERIMLELGWTDTADELLTFGNTEIMHSIRYRLREQTPEEDREMRT